MNKTYIESSSGEALDDLLLELEGLKHRIAAFRKVLTNEKRCSFTLVTIPTLLAVKETMRLALTLQKKEKDGGMDVKVRAIVINQLLSSSNSKNSVHGDANDVLLNRYFKNRVMGQTTQIQRLAQSPSCLSTVITPVDYSPVEIVGVPALSYFSLTNYETPRPTKQQQQQQQQQQQNSGYAIKHSSSSSYTFADLVTSPPPSGDGCKIVVFGGKGGVGKTTSSAAAAMGMARAGHKVALISTDPAHSLFDALDITAISKQGGGEGGFVDVTPPDALANGGSVLAMEIDTEGGLNEFRTMVRSAFLGDKDEENADNDDDSSFSSSSSKGGDDATMESLLGILDAAPPGSDEAIALSKVMKLIRRSSSSSSKQEQKFTRIVLDTAPTGHTVRMLTLPRFLDTLTEKILDIGDKLTKNFLFTTLLHSSGGGALRSEEQRKAAKREILSFQLRMAELNDVLRDEERSEFVIVTIPTALAVSESLRLLKDLEQEDITCNHILVNQILPEDDDDDERRGKLRKEWISAVKKGEEESINLLNDFVEKNGKIGKKNNVVKVEMMDVECKGVFGLRAMTEANADLKDLLE